MSYIIVKQILKPGRKILGFSLNDQESEIINWITKDPTCEFTIEGNFVKENDPDSWTWIKEKFSSGQVLVMKVGYLLHNRKFIEFVFKAEIDFIFVDFLSVTKDNIKVISELANHQFDLKSSVTKSSLHESKQNGVRLGTSTNLLRADTVSAQKKAVESNIRLKKEWNKRISPVIKGIVDEGITSFRGISLALNARGIKTRHGKSWYAGSVKRVKESNEYALV